MYAIQDVLVSDLCLGFHPVEGAKPTLENKDFGFIQNVKFVDLLLGQGFVGTMHTPKATRKDMAHQLTLRRVLPRVLPPSPPHPAPSLPSPAPSPRVLRRVSPCVPPPSPMPSPPSRSRRSTRRTVVDSWCVRRGFERPVRERLTASAARGATGVGEWRRCEGAVAGGGGGGGGSGTVHQFAATIGALPEEELLRVHTIEVHPGAGSSKDPVPDDDEDEDDEDDVRVALAKAAFPQISPAEAEAWIRGIPGADIWRDKKGGLKDACIADARVAARDFIKEVGPSLHGPGLHRGSANAHSARSCAQERPSWPMVSWPVTRLC
jgi:hypothetical protein